jgi:hypothetical protein
MRMHRKPGIVLLLMIFTTAVLALAQQPEQRIPGRARPTTGVLLGIVLSSDERPVIAANVTVRQTQTGAVLRATTNADGIFRLRDVPAGRYELKIEHEGYESIARDDVRVSAGESVSLHLKMQATTQPAQKAAASGVPLGLSTAVPLPEEPASAYPGIRRPPAEAEIEFAQPLPPENEVFVPSPDRWTVAMPEDYRRYSVPGEFPYVKSRWWDPFNRNKLKGDYPIIGNRTFFTFTGLSETLVDAPRRLPTPSNVAAARPGSIEFFGHGGQGFLNQNFRFTFDLTHGDTSFRPADWRIRITTEANINYIHTRERGIVNQDVRFGTDRTDGHVGLQEAFVEYKLHDLSPNYDFVSVRVGIQQFTSDFRGFVYSEEQPGIRLFGNLRSNRINYNLAYFFHLEKDSNSGLNTFENRKQQVGIANIYIQDFIWKGYTTSFSFHYNRDDADFRFDTNHFLVRPAPIGAVTPHQIKAYYAGWSSNGHIKRINVSHAFYQVYGHDTLNPISGRRQNINARMGALELSLDKDWVRFKTSMFYGSGDANPRNGHATGFDTIVDNVNFAGGIFSLWNREGIRLTGTGVALTTPASLLASLRPSKEEGQANFVNPGIWVVHAGADFDITPKLRGFLNTSYLRFDRTEALQLLLFQAPVRHHIGQDSSIGVTYRPPLTENISLTGGAALLNSGQGFRDIYSGKNLFSVFGKFRFQF